MNAKTIGAVDVPLTLKAAALSDPVARPRDRDKALSAAYLRILGHTQTEAASGAGCAERTLRQWESCSWWPEILAEAESRWLSGLMSKARGTLLRNMDANLALKILERRIPELAPVKQHVEHGGSIETGVAKLSDEELVKTVDRLTASANASTNGAEAPRGLTGEYQ